MIDNAQFQGLMLRLCARCKTFHRQTDACPRRKHAWVKTLRQRDAERRGRRDTRAARRRLLRANPYCSGCGAKVGKSEAQVDHIVGLSDGGTNSDENLQLLCVSCHTRKTAVQAVQGRMKSRGL